MQDFRHGDEDAFNRIFHDLYQTLCFYGNTITGDQAVSEEIAATSFLKVWERRSEFQHFLSLKSYLYTTVRNASIDWLRKKQSEAKARMGMVSALEVTERTRLEQLVIAETYRELYTGINKLPAQCRQIITMIFIDGKSTKEIAKELNITVDNIRVQKARGLKLLRQSVHHLHFSSTFIIFILYNFF